MNSRVDSHIAQTTTLAEGGSKQVHKYVFKPANENDGSFKNDKSGHLIVLVVVAFFAIMAIFAR